MRKWLFLVILYILIIVAGAFIFWDSSPVDIEPYDYNIENLFLRPNGAIYHQNQVLGVSYRGNDLPPSDKMALSGSEAPLYGEKEQIKAKIREYDWNHDVAIAVVRHESNFRPDAYNLEGHNGCNGSFGLFQIACVHYEYYDHYSDFYDWEYNIEVAYELWKREGWIPWGVCQPPNQKVVCWL